MTGSPGPHEGQALDETPGLPPVTNAEGSLPPHPINQPADVRAFFRLNTMQLNKNSLPSRKESEARFISILKEQGHPVTRERAAKLTGYSLHHAGKYLCHLRAMGILTSEKVKGETRWAIASDSPDIPF